MGGPADGDERRAWTIALGLVGAIYLSLYPLPFLLEALRERNLLRLAVAALFAAAALGVVAQAVARRARLARVGGARRRGARLPACSCRG